MKKIGGGIPYSSKLSCAYTDSGRSSLRLILKQGDLKDRHWWIPDYICQTVINVLKGFNVSFSTYPIDIDLSMAFPFEAHLQDVVYRVHYFGHNYRIPSSLMGSSPIIVDDFVFSFNFDNHDCIDHWYGFNSYRKISPLADGSLLLSTTKIDESSLRFLESSYVQKKYQAKAIKDLSMSDPNVVDEAYLELFIQGEDELDRQNEIFVMSARSHFLLQKIFRSFSREVETRKKLFEYLKNHLSLPPLVQPDIPSHYPTYIKNRRDGLVEKLKKNNIYLPIHWPKIDSYQHKLSQHILSVPLDSYYEINDMMRISEVFNQHLNEGQ
jgi:hypothetical protein